MQSLKPFCNSVLYIQCYKEITNITEHDAFILISMLKGCSIKEFIKAYPIEKYYDKDGDCKDYFYHKRALDTFLSIKDTFETYEDIFDFFFDVHTANQTVRSLFIKFFQYAVHNAGYNVFDVLDAATNPKPWIKASHQNSYLKIIK